MSFIYYKFRPLISEEILKRIHLIPERILLLIRSLILSFILIRGLRNLFTIPIIITAINSRSLRFLT